VHLLGVGEQLRRSLANTNRSNPASLPWDGWLVTRKRWHAGNQAPCWTATGLLEAEMGFRKVKGFRELPALQHKLNSALTQQVQVA